MLKTFQIAIRCGCIFALAAPVHANLITHNGIKVFEDTFENQALGQQPATGGISSGVGGWTFSFGTPDGPASGEAIP